MATLVSVHNFCKGRFMFKSLFNSNQTSHLPAIKRSPMSFYSLVAIYILLILIPWTFSYIEGLAIRGWYEELVTLLSISGLSMMLCQFTLLNTRVDGVNSLVGVDNSMRVHNKAGEILAILFFLHPFMILLPRFWVSPSNAWENLWAMFISPESATGFYAWSLLIVLVLMAIKKKAIGMSYEAWRYTHSFGFVTVLILATHHAVTVGRHGRYNLWFDVLWIVLCSISVGVVLYIYFIRPRAVARNPFKVVECVKGSADDWSLTIEKDGDFEFAFDAGQFVWLNTSDSVFKRNEHPFSIASSANTLPRLSFVIRSLGDYTKQLGKLKAGHRVWVDGPHGVFTLNARNAKGVVLIAGGAGIGPIIGLLRELKHKQDKRPVRLIYGNRNENQMMFQQELEEMRANMDFDYTLVLNNAPEGFTGHTGFIDTNLLKQTTEHFEQDHFDYYVCGSEPMVKAVEGNLKQLDVPQERILYEQLGF
jgi:predicted ferric reductase